VTNGRPKENLLEAFAVDEIIDEITVQANGPRESEQLGININERESVLVWLLDEELTTSASGKAFGDDVGNCPSMTAILTRVGLGWHVHKEQVLYEAKDISIKDIMLCPSCHRAFW
jgi:hypothetical protein